jgi:hypothetical protein
MRFSRQPAMHTMLRQRNTIFTFRIDHQTSVHHMNFELNGHVNPSHEDRSRIVPGLNIYYRSARISFFFLIRIP